jgi:glutaredoxin
MRLFSRVFLPFLLLIYIGLETYLKLQHTSLCEATGCQLAGELLRFDPIYLNYFGLLSILALFILGYRSLKSTFFETLFFMVLYAAIAFEATILSYQFIVNPEACLFCLGIFSSLLLIALFTHLERFTVVVVVVLSILLGLSTLAIPQNKSFIKAPGNYLIQSETCSHCKKVKAYFAAQHIEYTPIPSKEINARAFLKFLDLHTIPVLIIKEASGMKLLKGDNQIIAYFEAQQEEVLAPEVIVPPAQSSALDFPVDFLGAGQDEGCALTITETPSCEEHNTTAISQHEGKQ